MNGNHRDEGQEEEVDQDNELELLRAIYQHSRRQLKIAEEYRDNVGEPLRLIVQTITLLARIFGYLIAFVLGFMGLKEAFDGFVAKYFLMHK